MSEGTAELRADSDATPAAAVLTPERVAVEPWFVVYGEPSPEQLELQRHLAETANARFLGRAYVAANAQVVTDELEVGDCTFIAAGATVRGRVRIGSHSTVNAHAVIAGRVQIGNGVRIASLAAIFGFNHNFDDPDTPIFTQGVTEKGIVIEDDVWIGTHAVILDGVTVGAHSVVAAGAIVTRDVTPWSVVGGNPARLLKDRREKQVSHLRNRGLTQFDRKVAEQWPEVIDRCCGGGTYLDQPGAASTRRASCDAIEIAAAFGNPAHLGDTIELSKKLRSWQDPESGLVPEANGHRPGKGLAAFFDGAASYNLIAVDSALHCLGSVLEYPVTALLNCSEGELVDALERLPWESWAWAAGAWADSVGTALACNIRNFGRADHLETLFGWLVTRVDPSSGMWGSPSPPPLGWLQPVNGFYRATRGTFAQFRQPLRYPERVIQTVLAHGNEHDWFWARERNACNVLDVVHPMWLALKQCNHRAGEVRDATARVLEQAVSEWVDGEGMRFQPDKSPRLQGTEMWLSIIYLSATILGEADGLSWCPRGIHRLEPAVSLPTTGSAKVT